MIRGRLLSYFVRNMHKSVGLLSNLSFSIGKTYESKRKIADEDRNKYFGNFWSEVALMCAAELVRR